MSKNGKEIWMCESANYRAEIDYIDQNRVFNWIIADRIDPMEIVLRGSEESSLLCIQELIVNKIIKFEFLLSKFMVW